MSQPNVKCSNPDCGHWLKADAVQCERCKTYRKLGNCKFCKALMPSKATYCNACNSHQGLRGYLGISDTALALIAAIASSLTALYTQCNNYQNRNSNTAVVFTSAERNVIHAHIWNTGRRPSILRNYRLLSDEIKLQPVMLTPYIDKDEKPKSVIPAGGDTEVELIVSEINPQKGWTREGVLALIGMKRVTLQIDVEESTGESKHREDTFESERIRDLLNFKVTGKGKPR